MPSLSPIASHADTDRSKKYEYGDGSSAVEVERAEERMKSQSRRVSALEVEGGTTEGDGDCEEEEEEEEEGLGGLGLPNQGIRGAAHRRLLAIFGDSSAGDETENLVSGHPRRDTTNANETLEGILAERVTPRIPVSLVSLQRTTSSVGGGGGGGVLYGLVILLLLALAVFISPLTIGYLVPSSSNGTAPNDACPSSFVPEDVDALIAKVDTQLMKDRCDDERATAPGGGGCRCSNPIRPANYTDRPEWNRGFRHNLELVNDSIARGRANRLDVVLLGDSIVEFWMSTYKGEPLGQFKGNYQVYLQLFDSPTSPLQGLALGVAGDKCSQLLFRIQNGIIDGLRPKVFWVLIGTNDILGTACNADQVVAGNIQIVEELRRRRPDATVVVQSLLPTGTNEALTSPQLYAEVNQRLACFAANYKTDDDQASQLGRRRAVEFVNVTDLFLTPRGTVNTDLLTDGLHPNAAGAELWGPAIVRAVQRIIT